MTWPSPLRVHCGSSRIYLRGFVNVDVDSPTTFLATEKPRLVERWVTDDGDAYYARQAQATCEALKAGALPTDETVVDVKADILRGLPFGPQQIDELLCRQMFEHLSRHEARKFLQECDYAIKPGGVLRLDVPDHEATAAWYHQTGDRLAERHLFGTRKDAYSYHLHGYTREGLRALVEEYGFVFEREEPPLAHRLYPAFCLRWRKPEIHSHDPLPWARLIPIDPPATWRCLQVGPGSRRYWPRANAVVDVVDRGAPDDRPAGSEFHL